MLDMGFLPDVRRVLKHLPPRRQTLLFSATMPEEIAVLTREILKDPVSISLQRRAEPASGITQAAYPVGQALKSALLLALLRRGDMRSALVFTRTKHRANRLADWLVREGVRAARIHGNRSQSQRTQALEGFKAGRYQALVATDIAARGIDVEALGHVVNFDVPLASEDYIHRVGRTGRAEASGEAFTFVAPEEESSLRSIERAIGKRLPRVVLPDFDYAQAAPLARAPEVGRGHDSRPGRPPRPGPPRRFERGRSGSFGARPAGGRERSGGPSPSGPRGRGRHDRSRRPPG
jgi:ATP-dependent RNA helicase RhlE